MALTVRMLLGAIGILAVISALNVYLKLRSWMKGDTTSLERVDADIEYEMRGGTHGTYLRIERCDGRVGCIDFIKQTKNTSESYFYLVIDEGCCPPGGFERVKQYLEGTGLECGLESRPNRRLYVNCHRDTDAAVRAFRSIFTRLWSVPPNAAVRVRRKGPGALYLRDKSGDIKWQ